MKVNINRKTTMKTYSFAVLETGTDRANATPHGVLVLQRGSVRADSIWAAESRLRQHGISGANVSTAPARLVNPVMVDRNCCLRVES